jgi:hypothetical protein
VKDSASLAQRLAGRLRAAAGTLVTSAWPASTLMVPVTAAEPIVARWLRQDRVDFGGAPLHITVMYPFLPARKMTGADKEAIAELASGIEPFAFSLPRLDRFPGVTYLAPDPAAPFIRMTELIQRRWPSCVPYGGAYDEVVPHMTVTFSDEPPDPASLEQRLPITVRAEEIWLMTQTTHGWRTRCRFTLGNAGLQPCTATALAGEVSRSDRSSPDADSE